MFRSPGRTRAKRRCILGYTKASPDYNDWAANVNSCEDVVFDAGACNCYVPENSDCEKCTANIDCNWIKNAMTTVVGEVDFFGATLTFASTVNRSDFCWGYAQKTRTAGRGVAADRSSPLPPRPCRGSGFGPTFSDWEEEFDGFSLRTNTSVDEWCWGQCGLANEAFAVIILVVCLVIGLGLCGLAFFLVRKRGKTTG